MLHLLQVLFIRGYHNWGLCNLHIYSHCHNCTFQFPYNYTFVGALHHIHMMSWMYLHLIVLKISWHYHIWEIVSLLYQYILQLDIHVESKYYFKKLENNYTCIEKDFRLHSTYFELKCLNGFVKQQTTLSCSLWFRYNMKDPVCDMDVTKESVATEYKGKRYHFCCDMCKASFEKNPKQFVKE